MNVEIVVPLAFFTMIVVLALGIPLVRASIRRQDQMPRRSTSDAEMLERFTRIENAVESMAIEMERVSEGQRFTTKLLSERGGAIIAVPDARRRVES